MLRKKLILLIGAALSSAGCDRTLFEASSFATGFDPGEVVEDAFRILLSEPPKASSMGHFGLDLYNGRSCYVKTFHFLETKGVESTTAYASALTDATEDALLKSGLSLVDDARSRTGKAAGNDDIVLSYESDTASGSVKLFITTTEAGPIRVIGIIVEHPKIN